MAPRLPVAAASPCSGCAAPCCEGHQVPVDGYDLFRLVRGLGRPWDELVELDRFDAYVPSGFLLAPEGPYHTFLLRRGEGACRFLRREAGEGRCGAYALRPAACRVYPLVAADDEPEGSFVWGMARCDDARKAQFSALRPALRGMIDDDLGELALYFRVAARWNRAAERGAPGLSAAGYAAWLLDLYERIEPLRAGARGDWQPRAYRLVEAQPIPEIQGSAEPASDF